MAMLAAGCDRLRGQTPPAFPHQALHGWGSLTLDAWQEIAGFTAESCGDKSPVPLVMIIVIMLRLALFGEIAVLKIFYARPRFLGFAVLGSKGSKGIPLQRVWPTLGRTLRKFVSGLEARKSLVCKEPAIVRWMEMGSWLSCGKAN